MEKIAKFEKVSWEQFKADWADTFGPNSHCEDRYEALILPKRATAGSAGYDFHSPRSITLEPGQTVKIPTGIRAQIKDGWALFIFPRSGLGFKFRLQLDNTVGIVDSDYYYANNEGHIFIKVTNDGREGKTLMFERGTAFAQGVFLPYGITVEDNATAIRTGGFGSTDRK